VDYRAAYGQLASAILDYGMVIDSSYFGCARRFQKSQIAIVINPALSWRNRLFTLAHEIGHYFRLEGETLIPAKRIAGEALANCRAVKILELVLEDDVSTPYFNYYKKASRLPKPESWSHL
jgi:Zn-dependent peptidase ImmA (M78 family)